MLLTGFPIILKNGLNVNIAGRILRADAIRFQYLLRARSI